MSSLPVPVGAGTRLSAAEFVAQLTRAFQFIGVNRRVARCIGVFFANGFSCGGALKGGLQVALGQPDAGGEPVEQCGRFASTAGGSGRAPAASARLVEFRLQRRRTARAACGILRAARRWPRRGSRVVPAGRARRSGVPFPFANARGCARRSRASVSRRCAVSRLRSALSCAHATKRPMPVIRASGRPRGPARLLSLPLSGGDPRHDGRPAGRAARRRSRNCRAWRSSRRCLSSSARRCCWRACRSGGSLFDGRGFVFATALRHFLGLRFNHFISPSGVSLSFSRACVRWLRAV